MHPITTKIFFCICFYLVSGVAIAEPLNHQKQADQIIEQLYHNLDNKPTLSLTERIKVISAAFLDKPYLLGALGEGETGEFDQNPLYRTDAFDCETYVDTVLAMAFSTNLSGFSQCVCKIRYREGQVNYVDRNHFASLDWNRNNQKQGFTKDVTLTIIDENNKPVAEIAKTLIHKPDWYKFKTIDHIRIDNLSEEEKSRRLTKLQKAGSQLEIVHSEIPYLPLNKLFNEDGQANKQLFAQIPDASIIEIVRPNWNLRDKIGTNLNVSHLGFAIWENGTLIFRQASSIENRTIDVPLIDYLRDAMKSPTIKGINVQVIVPESPLSEDCKSH